jgi:TolA-binding protein
MKSTERHKLKENEFARQVAQARHAIENRKRDITAMVIVVVVLLAAVAGYLVWKQSRDAKANEMLAVALAIHEAPVVPLPEAKPGSPIPVQQPGTYLTEQAKLDAALPKFMEAAEQYPGAEAGIAARYHAASILAGLGRAAEAEQRFQEVVDKAGSSIWGRTARLGLADAQVAQGKYDNAINVYTEISRDPNSHIPVDSVLMQLGKAYARAGRNEEAAGAFNRIINDYPQSLYTADARRQLGTVKKSS